MNFYFCNRNSRDISSVGSEHRLDRAGVSGSNPLCPTKKAVFGRQLLNLYL